MCRTLDCGQLRWRATFHQRQKCVQDYKSFISLWHHLSSRFLPSRWRVLLIHLQMWPTPCQSLLTGLRGEPVSRHSSQLPFSTPLVLWISWTGWVSPCFDSFVYKVATWTLCPVNRGLFQMWGLDSLFDLRQNKETAAQKISWGSNVIFSIGKYVVVKIKHPNTDTIQ